MTAVAGELVVILALILFNGVLAMAEIAVVASRRGRLEEMAARGSRGARAALQLGADSNRFLSTVQVGITLVGVLAGALGGLTVADDLVRWLDEVLGPRHHHRSLAVGLVVISTTYLSLVIGELVPKRLALAHAERLAATLAPAMRLLSRATAPIVWLLGVSTDVILRILRAHGNTRQVTESEIRLMLAEGAQSGVLQQTEHAMVENVFRFADRSVSELMTPRSQVFWLDAGDPPGKLWDQASASGHFLFPVCNGDLQNVVGIAGMADLAAGPGVLQRLREPLFVPEMTPALRLPELFRQAGTRIAIVIDEHAAVQGIVTATDVLKALVGELGDSDDADKPVVSRGDGSWLVDGTLAARDLKELLGLAHLPGEERRGFITTGGLVMHALGRVPRTGDVVEVGGYRFEVADMDGLRVDKLLVSALPETTS